MQLDVVGAFCLCRLSKFLVAVMKKLGKGRVPWAESDHLGSPLKACLMAISFSSLEMSPRTKCQVKGSTEHLPSPEHTACLRLVGQC